MMLSRGARGTQIASSTAMMACRALALVALTGCILPPPIEEGSDVENQPPRILVETLSPPPQDLPKRMSVQCAQYRFFANVQDPDPNDTIYYRVFIDYLNNSDAERLDTEVKDKPPDETNPGAARLLTFSVDPTDERFGPESTKFEVSHAVELLISDRPFSTFEQAPVGRVVEEDGLTDSYTWPVQLEADVVEGCVE
jgi:hypothetical protein